MRLGELEVIYEVDGEPNPEFAEPIFVEEEEEQLVPAK